MRLRREHDNWQFVSGRQSRTGEAPARERVENFNVHPFGSVGQCCPKMKGMTATTFVPSVSNLAPDQKQKVG